MKKTFYLLACTIVAGTAVILSCSDDKEITPSTDIATKSLEAEATKGEVPKDRILYSGLEKVKNGSLNELIELYNKDVSTAEQSYMANLKNMWFALLRNKLATQGTEKQKLFFINEQASLPDNLAFFTDFYNLLATSKLLDKAEKENMASAFYEKNLKVINEVQWHTPREKKNKETELVYAKNIFHRLVSLQ